MKKISEKIMTMDFGKRLRQLLLAALCVAVLGGGLSAFMFRTQISETIAGMQQWEERGSSRVYEHKAKGFSGHEYEKQQGESRGENDDFFENIQITEPSAAAKAAAGATGLLCVLLFAAFWILIAAWLYQAAVLSEMNGILWLIAGLCANLPAALLFVLVRSFIRKKCPSCGRFMHLKTQCCTRCGASLYEKCPDCGEICKSGGSFCPSCGKEIKQEG